MAHEEELPEEDRLHVSNPLNCLDLRPSVPPSVSPHAGGEDAEVEGANEVGTFSPSPSVNYEAKLRELLRNLCAVEVEIYSEASKEFVKLLKGDHGGELLLHYVQSSPRCAELLEAWKLHVNKPGIVHIFALITAVLIHPSGRPGIGAAGRRLDALARSIISHNLDDIYKELKCEEFRRQNATLRLLAAIVRRGMGLASEVARTFDFKLPVLPVLSGMRKKKKGGKTHHGRCLTRKPFVQFAMSFLEVGNPRLLRWILQQRDMYFGVLCRLGSDDDDTVVLVLSVFHDKVLSAGSMLPPGLRSVLFGSVTLEQLIGISGNSTNGDAADLAHRLLVKACTDPCNGLMPGSHLKGNPARLIELMKKLRATEIASHKELLLAIAKGRPTLCSSYMDVFPFSMEPSTSPLWFSATSLTADLVLSANSRAEFDTLLRYNFPEPPNLESPEMRCILKCIVPPFFSRSVSNKGLLHSNVLVKHASLRVVLEMSKSLHRLLDAIGNILEEINLKLSEHASESASLDFRLPGFKSFDALDNYLLSEGTFSSNPPVLFPEKWVSFKEQVQDEVRSMLPDAQVLLKLLSFLTSKGSGNPNPTSKRCQNFQGSPRKRPRCDTNTVSDDDIDIVIGGLPSENKDDEFEDAAQKKKAIDVDTEDYTVKMIDAIWGSPKLDTINEVKAIDVLFHTKLLDVLAFYLRTIPNSMEGIFDFMKALPPDPSRLMLCQKQSLLSLLVEYAKIMTGSKEATRAPDMMYKHLLPLVNMLILSDKTIQQHAYMLSRLAMLSTGAFDQNVSEVDAWFLFLPGFKGTCPVNGSQELHGKIAAVIVPFLCDAVSTVGNNLYKYLDHMHILLSKLKGVTVPLSFGPFVICILQKCLRLIDSDSGTSKTSDKAMISLYISNSISFLMQTQVNASLLAGLVDLLLTEKFGGSCTEDTYTKSLLCEWYPLEKLLVLSRRILLQEACDVLVSLPQLTLSGKKTSISAVIDITRNTIENGHDARMDEMAIAFSSAVVCSSFNDTLENLPLLITIAQHLYGACPHFLMSVLFLEWGFLFCFSQQWPDVFHAGFEMVEGTVSNLLYHDSMAHISTWKELIAVIMKKPASNSLNSKENASISFGLFLKHLPFLHVFCPLMNFSSSDESVRLTMTSFLRSKICEKLEDSVVSLRLVLFWAYQIRSSYKSKLSKSLERLFEMCYTLIDSFLDCLLIMPSGKVIFKYDGNESSFGLENVWEIAELILLHPLAAEISTHSLLAREDGFNISEDFLCISKSSLHVMDSCILDLISKVADKLLKLGNCGTIAIPERIVKSFRGIMKRSIVHFKRSFRDCISRKNVLCFVPSFSVFNALMPFKSPMVLLKMGHWMLHQINKNFNGWISAELSILPLSLYVCGCAFDALCKIFKQNKLNKLHTLLWEEEGYEDCLPQNLYLAVLDFALRFNLESANLCLLKAVTAAYIQKTSKSSFTLLPFSILIFMIISSSPLKVVEHCLCNMNKTKSKILLRLVEASDIHLCLFGRSFVGIMNKVRSFINGDGSVAWDMTSENCNNDISTQSLILMLPCALSFVTSNICKFEQGVHEIFGAIPLFYSKLLLDGFTKWNQFTCDDLFYEDYDDADDLHYIFSQTLLRKSLLMLHRYLISSECLIKESHFLKIFESIYSSASIEDQLLDFEVAEFTEHSRVEFFNQVNRITGKLFFTFLLLFPHDKFVEVPWEETEMDYKAACSTNECDSEKHAMLKFMEILISAHHKIVRNFSLEQIESNEEILKRSGLLLFFEKSILRSILLLSRKTKNLIGSRTASFLEKFVKNSLFHRFEDQLTIRVLHSVLDLLQGGYSSGEMLELLLGHSKIASVIQISPILSHFSSLIDSGIFLQPVPSIFKEFDLPSHLGGKDVPENSLQVAYSDSCCKKSRIEVIRIVRLLYNLTIQQHATLPGVVHTSKQQLLYLLLSGYGASSSETDREIFNFIQEIESSTGPESATIRDFDCLWGASVSKLMRERKSIQEEKSNNIFEPEAVQERSRQIFRENLTIDAKLCALTTLNLCRNYQKHSAYMNSCGYQLGDKVDFDSKILEQNSDSISYDPVFILRFSLHSLLKGYIKPLEFARLGLLSISLVALSSHDTNIRKLGYEFLGCFQKYLVEHQKSKDALQLQLLLTCLQNGITEQWQRIPSMVTIFASEVSLILMDTSKDHFHEINKFLMQSSKLGLKEIPLFHKFFKSSSKYFHAERLWILRLIHAGLNYNDDAHILIKNSIVGLLLSFYASSLSDSETRFLILQIIKKAIKFQSLTHHLVEHCGLICWLHAVLLDCSSRVHGAWVASSYKELYIVLEIILDVISLRSVVDLLQHQALEMLSGISSHLLMALVHNLKLLKRSVWIVNTIIGIITTTLRVSQKRKIYQPHFTVSLEVIFQLTQSIRKELCIANHGHTIYSGVNMLLMSCPPPALVQMDKIKLLYIILWAVSSALQLCSGDGLKTFSREPNSLLPGYLEKQETNEIIGRLLRWITASVTLGFLVHSQSKTKACFHRTRHENLQSLLENEGIEQKEQISSGFDFNINHALAVTVLYLQQLVGAESNLSSVTSALCVLVKDAYNLSEVAVLGEEQGFFMKLCSRISSPVEANPSWRWSFYQPWREMSYEPSPEQLLDEHQACRELLVAISNILGCKSPNLPILSPSDLKLFHAWERQIALGNG